ncbi:hypothetical protein C8R45DRAFT_1100603 [Mycena sanguinolenta]|nr:hypothetical protein C8R45DRAFT_1100603 [Mycena sanguinolenta]
MPHQATLTKTRLENLAASLAAIAGILDDLNDTFAPPFIQPVSKTIVSIVNLIQNVKQNKKDCARLLEDIHQVLYAIIDLHIKSEAMGSLSPTMTMYIGKFMKTLHKIYTYIEAQQDGSKIKQLFRNNSMNNLLKDCYVELEETTQIFGVRTGAIVFEDIGEMKATAEAKHKELLELISTMSESNITTDGYSVHLGANELKNR